MKQSLTNVLWLNNNMFITDGIIKKASNDCGLNIEAFNCWDDLYKDLLDRYDYWSALIIEPFSKLHSNSDRKPQLLLPKVFNDLGRICAQKGRIIPWFIFSDRDSKDFIELIIEDRTEFDKSWPKIYYEYGVDDEVLLQRIKDATQAPHVSVVRNKYANIYKDLNYLQGLNLSYMAVDLMESLLINLEFDKGNCTHNNARKIIEYIFHSMVANGVLPEFINATKDLNIGYCCRLLSHDSRVNNVHVDRFTTCRPIPNTTIMPALLADRIHEVISLGNEDSHASTKEIQFLRDYEDHLPNNTLLKISTLVLCDVIAWYANFMKNQMDEYGSITPWWEFVRFQ